MEDTLQFLESLANKVASVHGSPAFRRRPSMSCISRIPDLNPYLARDFPHAAIALPAAVARDMGIRRGDHLITIKHCNMSRTPPRRRSNVRVGSSISCSSIERPPSLPRPDHLAGHSLHSFHEGPRRMAPTTMSVGGPFRLHREDVCHSVPRTSCAFLPV